MLHECCRKSNFSVQGSEGLLGKGLLPGLSCIQHSIPGSIPLYVLSNKGVQIMGFRDAELERSYQTCRSGALRRLAALYLLLFCTQRRVCSSCVCLQQQHLRTSGCGWLGIS
jgi:hypothetical protein